MWQPLPCHCHHRCIATPDDGLSGYEESRCSVYTSTRTYSSYSYTLTRHDDAAKWHYDSIPYSLGDKLRIHTFVAAHTLWTFDTF